MYSILVYPNITYSKDLEKDSYVVVLRNVIKYLNRIRDDLEWTILSPSKTESLVFPNTQQVQISLPTYPNQMRCHFDTVRVLKALRHKDVDYDLVYSHLPEHTLQLKNLIYNKTNMRPVFIGYSHWTEFRSITSYPMTVRDLNILGILETAFTGTNTEARKNMIVTMAHERFNKATIKRLEAILQAQYLGAEDPPKLVPVAKEIREDRHKIIAFNHRPDHYNRYDWFIKQMDELWKRRQDFRVWVSLGTAQNRPYLICPQNRSKAEYYTLLSLCYVGVCAKNSGVGWSVSATDGLSVGLPYLFTNDAYCRELHPEGLFYNNDQEFAETLDALLDFPTIRQQHSEKALSRFGELRWPSAIGSFNEVIEGVLAKVPKAKKDNKSYRKVLEVIKVNGAMTKREIIKYLNWSDQFSFTPIRNRLRDDCSVYSGRYVI